MSISSEKVKRWRKNNKQRIIDSMGSKCQCCGYNRCNDALDLHHIDPALKEISFGKLRANPISWKRIVEELKKCILVCAVCHREIHSGIREIPDIYITFDESYTEYRATPKIDIKKGRKHLRKFEVSKDELLKLVWQYPTTVVAKMFGVSDKAIEKRCNILEINKPPRGYWAKKNMK